MTARMYGPAAAVAASAAGAVVQRDASGNIFVSGARVGQNPAGNLIGALDVLVTPAVGAYGLVVASSDATTVADVLLYRSDLGHGQDVQLRNAGGYLYVGQEIRTAAGVIRGTAAGGFGIVAFDAAGTIRFYNNNAATLLATLTAAGVLTVLAGGGLDTAAAGALNIGGANATSVTLSAGGTPVLGISTALVNFITGSTALGGGAAPTFGTIGGTGPAVAGQNAWLKVNIGGTASFIPYWR